MRCSLENLQLDLEPNVAQAFNSVAVVGFVGADPETRQGKVRTVLRRLLRRRAALVEECRGGVGFKGRVASRLLIFVSGLRELAKESRPLRSPCSGH